MRRRVAVNLNWRKQYGGAPVWPGMKLPLKTKADAENVPSRFLCPSFCHLFVAFSFTSWNDVKIKRSSSQRQVGEQKKSPKLYVLKQRRSGHINKEMRPFKARIQRLREKPDSHQGGGGNRAKVHRTWILGSRGPFPVPLGAVFLTRRNDHELQTSV